jgi:uncharacterized delta-60 repeat protein
VDFPGYGEHVNDILELPDGKLLVVGSDVSNSGNFAVTRHHFDGTLDTSFATAGKLSLGILNGNDSGRRATLQPDGKILITGHAHNGTNWDLAIARISYDGVLDATFDGDGKLGIPDFNGTDDYGYAVLSMPDGKIVIAGRSGNDIALTRLFGDSNQNAAAANIAPVNSIPAEVQSTQVNTPLAFTDFRDNRISTSDADAGANK